MNLPRIAWDLLRRAGTEFMNDSALRLAAALAFYTTLSLAPLLLIVISLAGMVFGQEAARGELVGQLRDMMGKEGADAVESMLAASQPQHGGVVAGIVGVVTLIVGATGVFASLQDSLNAVWNVDPARTSAGGLWGMIRDRLLSFSMVCGMAFLLLVSLVVTAVVHGLSGAMTGWLPPALTAAVGWANSLIALFVTFAMFAMIFKVLPHTKLAWSDVWFGAAVTTGLFEIGRYLIGLYIGKAAPGSTFGAAGSFVVLLLWVYYSSIIVLFGAEVTQVYATRRGSATTPEAKREAAEVAADGHPPAIATVAP